MSEDREALLKACVERQIAARARLLRELKELDEATHETLAEYMALVQARASREGGDGGRER
jgi:hypothetical protein